MHPAGIAETQEDPATHGKTERAHNEQATVPVSPGNEGNEREQLRLREELPDVQMAYACLSSNDPSARSLALSRASERKPSDRREEHIPRHLLRSTSPLDTYEYDQRYPASSPKENTGRTLLTASRPAAQEWDGQGRALHLRHPGRTTRQTKSKRARVYRQLVHESIMNKLRARGREYNEREKGGRNIPASIQSELRSLDEWDGRGRSLKLRGGRFAYSVYSERQVEHARASDADCANGTTIARAKRNRRQKHTKSTGLRCRARTPPSHVFVRDSQSDSEASETFDTREVDRLWKREKTSSHHQEDIIGVPSDEQLSATKLWGKEGVSRTWSQ
ncbi:hypothetical protein B0H10DRAFT_2386627 [Mycena sp. CBHHK59/15]|nr:hypothetical protein B0H10DRAFT_2386627 [Mycena sp. CBHHK59/15]